MVKNTNTKDDFDYVPLGLAVVSEPFTLGIGITGWGTSHSLMLTVVTDWFNEASGVSADDKVTVFLKDNKGGGQADMTQHLSVIYRHRDGEKSPVSWRRNSTRVG
jgi:hypothetical protein